MMFWFTVRPAIKEFIQRVKEFPEQFVIGFSYLECRETGTYLDFKFSGAIDEIRTDHVVLYRRQLSFGERRELKKLCKHCRKIYDAKEYIAHSARVARGLASINPEKLVKEND